LNNPTDNDQHPAIDCESLENFVVEFLDGQLPQETRQAFLKHIEECKHCKEYLQSYRKSIDLSKAALNGDDTNAANQDGAIPDKLVEAIMAASRKTR